MFTIKKIILLFTVLIWMSHSVFAAPVKQNTPHKKSVAKHTTHTKNKHAKKKTHHTSKHKTKKPVKKAPVVTENDDENENEYVTLTQANPPPSFVASIEQRLVEFIQKSVSSLQYSSYKLGGSRVDTNKGIYIVDCSGYVDHTLRAVFPNAYFSLVDSSGTEKPNSLHYYNFFKGLANDPNEYWSKVEDIEQLQPGDILVFRYKNLRGKSTGGHVMVVMDKIPQDDDTYLISVADSAPVGHSQDTRQAHVSGVGIGSLLLKVNPETRRPAAYAWKVGSRWKRNVNIAMARPTDTQG